MNYSLQAIGTCFTCYDEKFAIPRQSGLVPSSYGFIKLNKEYEKEEALRGLESFSHLYLTWLPHKAKTPQNLTVRPPRLGGNKRLGVFATRSPFRPNPICQSIVELSHIDNFEIHFKNHDILNNTPLLDIRPYIPHVDCIPNALGGWAEGQESQLPVFFSSTLDLSNSLRNLIQETLKHNPLPRYKQERAHYGFRLAGHEVKVEFSTQGFWVHDVIPLGAI